MVTIDLLVEQIKDPAMRENMLLLQRFLRAQPILGGEWIFREYVFTQAETNKKLRHGLTFRPKDIIQTSLTGAGAITWNYGVFDNTFVDVSTTGACVVRAFIGRYEE